MECEEKEEKEEKEEFKEVTEYQDVEICECKKCGIGRFDTCIYELLTPTIEWESDSEEYEDAASWYWRFADGTKPAGPPN